MTYKLPVYKTSVLKLLLVAFCLLCNIFVIIGQNRKSNFPKGSKAYTKFIKDNLVMPNHIERGDTEGKVIIKLYISEKGKIVSTEIVQSLDSICDAEVLRVVSLMPQLEPALENGNPIISEKKLNFYFRNYEPAKFESKKMSLYKYIGENLVKPAETENNARGTKVVVKLFITKEGKVEEATIEKGLSTECDQEALRFAKGMPAWKPATRDGQKIDSYYNLDVPFEGKLIMPEFIGGEKFMMIFIKSNLKYPSYAQQTKKEGRVLVRFAVDTEGNIKDAEVIKSVYPSLDREALRVVNDMPKWKPGTIGGTPVEVYFTLPILFRLRPETETPRGNRARDSFGRKINSRF